MVVFREKKKKGKKENPPFFSLSLFRCRGGVAGGGGWDCRGEVPTGRCVVQEETKPSRWKQGWVSVACFTMVHYHRRPMVNQAQRRYGSSFPSHDCFWTSLNLCTWIILKSSVMDVIWLFFSPVYLLHGLLWCKLLLWLEFFFFKPNKLAGNPMEMTEVQELNAAAKKLSGM